MKVHYWLVLLCVFHSSIHFTKPFIHFVSVGIVQSSTCAKRHKKIWRSKTIWFSVLANSLGEENVYLHATEYLFQLSSVISVHSILSRKIVSDDSTSQQLWHVEKVPAIFNSSWLRDSNFRDRIWFYQMVLLLRNYNSYHGREELNKNYSKIFVETKCYSSTLVLFSRFVCLVWITYHLRPVHYYLRKKGFAKKDLLAHRRYILIHKLLIHIFEGRLKSSCKALFLGITSEDKSF